MKLVPTINRLDNACEASTGRQPETARTSSRIVLLTRAITVGLAATLSAAANADEPQRSTPAAKVSIGRDPVLEPYAELIREAIPDLDHDEPYVRAKAQKIIGNAINAAIGRRNPLPASFHALFETEPGELPSEARHALHYMGGYARLQEEKMPKRAAGEEQELPSVSVLERRFGMPVFAENPAITEAIRVVTDHKEGDTLMQILKRLCERFNCVPELTSEGLMLRAGDPSSVRFNNDLCVVGGEKATAFLLPDRGVLLGGNEELISDAPIAIATGGAVEWQRVGGIQRVPLIPISDLMPVDGHIQAYVGTGPETQPLDLDGDMEARFGQVTFRTICMDQDMEGNWITFVGGTVLREKGRFAGSREEDAAYYQLVAHAACHVECGGVSLKLRPEQLSFDFTTRDLCFVLKTPEEPRSIKIHALSEVSLQSFELPTD